MRPSHMAAIEKTRVYTSDGKDAGSVVRVGRGHFTSVKKGLTIDRE